MSDISLPESPAFSISSFSTACTTLPPTKITRSQRETTDEKTHDRRKKLVRNRDRPSQGREITNQTLLLSSPLATLIYTASSTATALPLTNARSEHVPPTLMPVLSEKGNVLRKKRARGGRPERLVRMGGPEVKAMPKKAVVDLNK